MNESRKKSNICNLHSWGVEKDTRAALKNLTEAVEAMLELSESGQPEHFHLHHEQFKQGYDDLEACLVRLYAAWRTIK